MDKACFCPLQISNFLCQFSLSTIHVQYNRYKWVIFGRKKKKEPVYLCPEKLKMSLNWDAGTWDEKHLKVSSESLEGILVWIWLPASGFKKL